jgi:transcriptional regulator with XRE-family HTH domain
MKSETLAQYVTRWRKDHKQSASDIERLSGREITDGYINLVASGKQKNLTVDKLIALAKGMGDNPHNLLDVIMGENVPESADPWPSFMLLKAMDRIVNDAVLSDIMKVLLQMDARQLEAAKKTLGKAKPAGQR